MKAIVLQSKLDLPIASTLCLEFHGTEASVAEQAETVQAIASDHSGNDFRWTTLPEDRKQALAGAPRRRTMPRCLAPGKQFWRDRCLRADLAACRMHQRDQEATSSESSMPAPLVGHVGDGNFHLSLLLDPDDPKDVAEAERLNTRLVARALAMDGTCTGEHGVGWGKIDFLAGRARRGAQPHAHAEEGDRSRQHHEPRKDRPDVRSGLSRALRPPSARRSRRR